MSQIVGTGAAIVVMAEGSTTGPTPGAAPSTSSAGTWVAVGYSSPGAGLEHAVVWNGTTPTVLTTPNGYAKARAYCINDSGIVGGYSLDTNTGIQYPTIWNGTVGTLLPNLPGYSQPTGVVTGINALGTACGWSYASDGNPRACTWTAGAITQIESLNSEGLAINSAGVVAGYYVVTIGLVHTAATWAGGVRVSYNAITGVSTDFRHAYAINDSGLIGGESSNGSGFHEATEWNLGVATAIALTPTGTNVSAVNAINSSGVAAGVAVSQATTWDAALNQTTLPGGGAANAIDNFGTIAGTSGGPVVWFSGAVIPLSNPSGETGQAALGIQPDPA